MSWKSLTTRKGRKPKSAFRKQVQGPWQGVKRLVNRQIRRVIGLDYKFVDTDMSGTADYTTGIIGIPTAVAQGNADNQRIGDDINLRSIAVQGYIQHPTAANPPVASVVRLLLVLDTENQNAAPTLGNIFTGAVGNSVTINSFKQIATTDPKRFRILWDRRMVLPQPANGVAAGSTAVQNKYFKVYKRFKQDKLLKQHYVTNAAGGYQKNTIFFIAFSNIVNAAGGAPGVNATARVRYTDA